MKPQLEKIRLPLGFQINYGQSTPEVKFLVQANGYNLFLAPAETVISLRPVALPARNENSRATGFSFLKLFSFLRKFSFFKDIIPEPDSPPTNSAVRLKFNGANPNPVVMGLEELPGRVNYFIGHDPAKWYTDIPIYAKVKYQDIYPGIDIVYFSNQEQIEWDFIVHPGADPSLIAIEIEGSEQLTLDKQGDLLLTAGGQLIRISKPVVYQQAGAQRTTLAGSYILNNKQQVRFRLDEYDTAKPLIIDPLITYSTYLGGANEDFGYSIAVDSAANAYIAGYTWSSWINSQVGYPIKDPYQADNPGYYTNAFITKISAAGSLVYSTYLGGTGTDAAWSIAVDAAGSAYVTGSTSSPDFPTTNNALQPNFNGYTDAFVTKLNPAGNGLIYSTYLGGAESDIGYGIAVDTDGNAYVTGVTESSATASPISFPVKNAIQANNNSVPPLGTKDVFVTKINAAGDDLVYSTYLGGAGDDIGYGIAVDAAGNVYVTGSTSSHPQTPPLQGFPITSGCFQPDFGGDTDAFITKINADGTAVVYSTYLGGKAYDEGRSIAVDAAGCVYVTGFTASRNTQPPGFPTKNALQADNSGDFDAFVTKLNAEGTAIVYSTYLGGENDDRSYGIAVDSAGNAYITGYTYSAGTDSSPGFPTKYPIQLNNNGLNDAFVAKIKADGSALHYSTYLGGLWYDGGYGIAVDTAGNAYIAGLTYSAEANPPFGPPGFPVKNPIQPDNYGAADAFVLKIGILAKLAITKSAWPDPATVGQKLCYSFNITNNGPDPATNVILTDQLAPDVEFIAASSGCSQAGGIVTCSLGTIEPASSASVTITVKPKKAGIITNTATVISSEASPASVTVDTQVNPGIPYTSITIVRNWRANPPKCR